MSWNLAASNAVNFADGNTGHLYTFSAGAPTVGALDVLCVNSATTVSTPSSSGGAAWTLGPTFVGNQGSYLWYRIATGGEPSTVTVTTSGNFPTALGWSRWTANSVTADVHAVSSQDNNNASTTPAVTTGTLGATGELSIAFAALSGFSAVSVSSPSWSAGYTALTGPAQSGTGSTDVAQWVGYNTNAGTAAETPNVSWTNLALDQYMLVQTFEPGAAPSPPPAVLYSMRMFP